MDIKKIIAAICISISCSGVLFGAGLPIFLNKKAVFPFGINYFPQDKVWNRFWSTYSNEVVEKDFELINRLGFNSVRVAIHYPYFSKKKPTYSQGMTHLKHLLDTALKNDLTVVLTLLDWAQVYGHKADMLSHISSIVSPIKSHPAILAWDLKNEPDTDYKFYKTPEIVHAGLTAGLAYLRVQDPAHPVTIGWLRPPQTSKLNSLVDFISFHHYADGGSFQRKIATIRKASGTLPILQEEFGFSTWLTRRHDTNTSEALQRFALNQGVLDALESGLAGMYLWTLYDHRSAGGGASDEKENFFGIIKLDGTQKTAAQLFSQGLWADWVKTILKVEVRVCWRVNLDENSELKVTQRDVEALDVMNSVIRSKAGVNCIRKSLLRSSVLRGIKIELKSPTLMFMSGRPVPGQVASIQLLAP